MENQKEKQAVIRAGKDAIRSLKEAQKNLSKAKDLGLVDILSPLGITAVAKNQRIEEAKRNVQRAKRDLKTFATKASGLSQVMDINIDVSDMLVFADAFFNNMMVDFYVYSKIDKAQRQITDGIRRVESLIRQIEI